MPRKFFKWKVLPIADQLGIDRKLCTFQVLPRTLGTDLQTHGTMKDAQTILRHKQIKTTAEVYMDHIPERVRKAIEPRTDAVFAQFSKKASQKIFWGFAREPKSRTRINTTKNGSSGRTRTYNPPVNSRMLCH